MDRKASLVIAHRAAAAGCPENSLAGIRASGEIGVDIVEVDVRRTIDGVPVLIHDPILGRRTDGHGLVRLARAQRVARRRLEGSGETVPTLEEAFDALPFGVAIGVHLKDRGALGAVLNIVARRGAADRTWLWLEWPQDAQAARRRFPAVRMVLLNDWRRGNSTLRYLEAAEAAGATAVSIPWGRIEPYVTAEFRRSGLLVFAMERNPEELLGKVAAGLDGVITNHPAAAAARLRRLGEDL